MVPVMAKKMRDMMREYPKYKSPATKVLILSLAAK
jgi:hypothetical protein